MNNGHSYPKTLVEAVRYFSDLDVAHAFFASARWPDGVICCPRCGSIDVRFLAAYRRWECKAKHPRRQFTVKVGTIMEDSPLGLDKWAVGFWLEANAKNGISSYEVHRALGITQKSAWFMLHRIRLAMQSKSFGKLSGEIEADETYIGGRSKFMHAERRKRTITGTGGAGKACVLGILARGGEVRTAVLKEANKPQIHDVIHKHVEPGSCIFTDSFRPYRSLSPQFFHQFIDHTVQYVRGNVHTNGLENFWALFKRCIKGTHISIEPFHIFRYLDSEMFRYNNRKLTDGERMILAAVGMSDKRLTYKALIGNDPEGRIANDFGADRPN
jgi:transposase-like protein